MIVLDTNVLSALMSDSPDSTVAAWLDRQPASSLWTSAVTVFELRLGVGLLAPGRRRRFLDEALDALLTNELADRVLPFDERAAAAAATLAAQRRLAGRTVDFRDVEIAGVVLARGATLATRNTRHFSDAGIALVDPWTAR